MESAKPNLTRADIKFICDKRDCHRRLIRQLRMRYTDAIVRATTEQGFQTITTDGADSAKCHVPQAWRSNVHHELSEDDMMEQKMQTVLMHGIGLRFYPFGPFVAHGMNKTVSVLLDTLLDIPVELRILRWQIDGNYIIFGCYLYCSNDCLSLLRHQVAVKTRISLFLFLLVSSCFWVLLTRFVSAGSLLGKTTKTCY